MSRRSNVESEDDDCQGLPDFDEELDDDVFEEEDSEQEVPAIEAEKRTKTPSVSSYTSSSSGSTTTSSSGSSTSSNSSDSVSSRGTKVSMLNLGDDESQGSVIVAEKRIEKNIDSLEVVIEDIPSGSQNALNTSSVDNMLVSAGNSNQVIHTKEFVYLNVNNEDKENSTSFNVGARPNQSVEKSSSQEISDTLKYRLMMKKVTQKEIEEVDETFFSCTEEEILKKVQNFNHAKRFWLAVKFYQVEKNNVSFYSRSKKCELLGFNFRIIKNYMSRQRSLADCGGFSPVETSLKTNRQYFVKHALNLRELISMGELTEVEVKAEMAKASLDYEREMKIRDEIIVLRNRN